MAAWLRLREQFQDLTKVLVASGLEAGQTVLDYGCGIGSCTLPAAEIVGRTGLVYALDIHPLATETVRKRATKAGLSNIETILSGCDTGLESGSLDVVLLFDVLHAIQDQAQLLKELGRVLRPGGLLVVKPDHMTEEELLATMNLSGPFLLRVRRGELYEFVRQEET
jgi:ubiquinone/menaquinone biosynthesis C-methylase UbiE